jgi:NADPH-dependent ferric siderophore reductase
MALFLRATVTEVAPLTDRMRATRLTGDPLRGLAWQPGQHVRVNVTPPRSWLRNPGDARRTYSIWDLDARRGVLDLAGLDHGDGPGSDLSATGGTVSIAGEARDPPALPARLWLAPGRHRGQALLDTGPAWNGLTLVRLSLPSIGPLTAMTAGGRVGDRESRQAVTNSKG